MSNSQNLTQTLAEVKKAEERGQYNQAFALLNPFWNDFEQFPNAVGLLPEECAELFLRFGGIIGFLGNSQQISDSQEISKNLLTLALQRFTSLARGEKAADCENYLALAYARTGEFTEALDWLSASLARNLPENHPARLHAFVIETLLDMDSGKYERLLKRCAELKEIFDRHGSALQKGCFHNHLAMAHQNLGNADEALKNLKQARDFFLEADHKIYYGAAENNLAQWCRKVGRFSEAHECAQKALRIFEQIGDKTRSGYCLETRAQIFAAEGKYEKALQYANQAVEMLEVGESYRTLVETYRTKIRILLKLERLAEALTVMTAAHNLAALYISADLSREVIENTAALVEEKNKRRM